MVLLNQGHIVVFDVAWQLSASGSAVRHVIDQLRVQILAHWIIYINNTLIQCNAEFSNYCYSKLSPIGSQF